jgi:hypothetical protein
VPGGLARDRRSRRPDAHDGERRLAQQELRDAVDHHAPLTVEAVLTEGTIDAAVRIGLDVRGAQQQLDYWSVTRSAFQAKKGSPGLLDVGGAGGDAAATIARRATAPPSLTAFPNCG